MEKNLAADEMTEEQLLEAIEHSFLRWDHLMAEGGTTPQSPDGGDLNLVRNHIIYYRHHLTELRSNGQVSMLDTLFPSANRPVPPEVPNCFMVRNGKYADRVCRAYYPVLTHSIELDRAKWKPEDIF